MHVSAGQYRTSKSLLPVAKPQGLLMTARGRLAHVTAPLSRRPDASVHTPKSHTRTRAAALQGTGAPTRTAARTSPRMHQSSTPVRFRAWSGRLAGPQQCHRTCPPAPEAPRPSAVTCIPFDSLSLRTQHSHPQSPNLGRYANPVGPARTCSASSQCVHSAGAPSAASTPTARPSSSPYSAWRASYASYTCGMGEGVAYHC